MNPGTARKLDRVLRQLARRSRLKPRRFSTAPLIVALGFVTGYQSLARLVPRVWAATFPGGLEQAETLFGWPSLVWRLSTACRFHFLEVVIVMGMVTTLAFVTSTWLRPLRFLVWFAAIALILIDAGILVVTIRTALAVTADASGLF
ncbi:MAG: hypothetical protein ABI353_14450 [Isosphaeraceae bacterium]